MGGIEADVNKGDSNNEFQAHKKQLQQGRYSIDKRKQSHSLVPSATAVEAAKGRMKEILSR